EDADCGLDGLGPSIEAVADQAAVDGAAGELGIDARRITSVTSSSGNCNRVCSSQTNASSMADRLLVSVFGVCDRSETVVRSRQRRIVVSLTPSSTASSATGFLLRWM